MKVVLIKSGFEDFIWTDSYGNEVILNSFHINNKTIVLLLKDIYYEYVLQYRGDSN